MARIRNLEGKLFNLQGISPFCECKNGGTCLYDTLGLAGSVRRINTGSCYCTEVSDGIFESSGRSCQTLRNFCSPNPCAKGGRCVNKMGYFFCVDCGSGWSGHDCSKRRTNAKQWTEDVTVVWYPNSDFQVTSISWLRVSFAQPGTQPLLVYLEYFGILIPIREVFSHESIESSVKDCYEMRSEDVACDTYRKGINYYTVVLKAQKHYLAAPYNLIFGAELENALTINHPDWQYRMYAVKYELKIHVYSNNELVMPVTPLHLWHQVTSTYSACLPLISFDGCSTITKYPWRWLSHELVHIKLTARQQDNRICKNLVVELRNAVTFFHYDPHDKSDIATRPLRTKITLSNVEWQNNEELSFEQHERYFFGFNSFWIATFPLRLSGSYLSTVGRDLYLELNAMCFLHTEPPQTIVTVEGGNRIVDCTRSVEFQPLSTDPAFNLDLFLLRWSCTDDSGLVNPVCKPKISKWGPYKYSRLNCNRNFKFKLEPFHEYYKMSSSTNAGKPYVWTIKTEVSSTEIQILCWQKCVKVNPMDEVLVQAVESPLSGFGSPEWILYEGGINGTVLPLNEYKTTTGNPWFISIKRNSLKAGRTYAIEALTTRGRGSKEFETNSPPVNGTCKITPKSGIKGVTMFNITCENWEDEDSPLLYTFGINRNDLFEPLIESFYEDHLPSTVLFHENISVYVTDIYKMKTDFPLQVKLADNDEAYDFQREMNSFIKASFNRDYESMMKWIVKNSEAAVAEPDFPFLWKVEIFKNILETIPHVKYYYSMNRMVWSMLRLIKGNITSAEDGVQDIMIGVGQGLENTAGRLRQLCSSDESFNSMWDVRIHGILLVIITTADSAFMANDPLLLDSSHVSDGVKEIHRQKAKFGVWYVLNAFGTILKIARTIMVTDQKPYIFKKGGITIFTAVGRAVTLQEYLKEFGNDGSTVILSPNTISRLGIFHYAVEIIRTDNYAYHAWKPVVGQVLHIKFLRGPSYTIRAVESEFEEIEMSEGPYVVTVKMGSNLISRDVNVVVRLPDLSVTSESGLNRYLCIVHFRLPTGYGQVIVRLENKHIGKVKILLSHGYRPSYFEMMREQPVDKLQYELKYHNRDPVHDSDFYINFISHEQPVYQFEVKLTIVRCVIYVSDEWEAQKCKVMRLVESGGEYTATCHCYHLSSITSDFVLPEPDFRIGEDFSIFRTILDNFYVAVTMLTVLVLYFALLIWGKRKDSFDHKTRSVIVLPDNFPGDIHPYIIVVWTGKRIRAGTSSKVAIKIFGSDGGTRPHIFRSPDRSVLGMANDDWFLLYTANYLGNIKEIVLWHSSSGCRPDWYCSQITVYDIKTTTAYNFVVDRWFTVTEDLEDSKLWRGKLTRKGVWITDPENNVGELMGDHFFAGVREKHRWTSIFIRHPRSIYTRCERIATLGTMLISTMLTSIMFFGVEYGAPDLPFAYMSLEDVIVSLKSMLIGSVLSYVTLFTFQKAKKKEKLSEPETEKEVIQVEKVTGYRKKKALSMRKWYKDAKDNLPIRYLPVLDQKTLNAQIRQEKFNYWLMAAWIVSTIVLIGMSVVVIFYGLRYGKKRSLLWIQAFISGTLIDAFFLEPIKMIAFASVVALVFKRSSIGDIKVRVDYDQTEQPFKDYWSRLSLMMNRTKPEYKPMPYKRLKKIYKHRERMNVIRRYLLYMVILTLMSICAYLMCGALFVQYRYLANHHLMEILTGDGKAQKIHNAVGLNNFTIENLLPSIHRTKWYNGKELPREPKEPGGQKAPINETKGWCEDYNQKLLGVPRIRQQRLSLNLLATKEVSDFFKRFRKAGNLSIYFGFPLTFITLLNEDYRTYLIGWQKYDSKIHGNVTNLWKHSLIHDTETDIYEGETGIPYPGHGYVEYLYWNQGESAERYNALVMNNFLDNRTRVVFAELNLYNVNLNTFTSFVILVESLPSNIYVIRPLIDTAEILMNGDPFRTVGVVGSLVLIVILAFYIGYWVVESSRVGLLSAAMTWRGFSDFACILVGMVLAYQKLNEAVTFSTFGERLDTLPRDEYLSLYAYFYNNFKVEFILGLFSLLVMMAYTTAVHNLFGYHRIQRVLGDIVKKTITIAIINAIMFALIPFMMKSEPVILRYLLFDVLLKEPFHPDLEKLTHARILLVICFPISCILLKATLGNVIYYHILSERLGPKKSVLPVETFIKKFAMDLKDRTHDEHEKSVLNQLQRITKNFDLLSIAIDKNRRERLKEEEKLRKQEAKKVKKENKVIEKFEKEIAKLEANLGDGDRKGNKKLTKKIEQMNKVIAANEAAKTKRAEAIEAVRAKRAEAEAKKFNEGLRKYEAIEEEKARKAEAAAAAMVLKNEAAAAEEAKKAETAEEAKAKRASSQKETAKRSSKKDLAVGGVPAQQASTHGTDSDGGGFEDLESGKSITAAKVFHDYRKARQAKREADAAAKKEPATALADAKGAEFAETAKPGKKDASETGVSDQRGIGSKGVPPPEGAPPSRRERSRNADEPTEVGKTGEPPKGGGSRPEESAGRRERPRRERPPGGTQGDTRPGGSAQAIVEPTLSGKPKEAPKGAKPDERSRGPSEEPSARRKRPPGGTQGETKPSGSTPAVVEPTVPRKNKEGPKGEKLDERSGPPTPEQQGGRRERPRRERPPGSAQGEAKPGGSAPTVVKPTVPSKTKEAPKGAKPDERSGGPPEEPPVKSERPRRERPLRGAQGEMRPEGPTPAPDGPTAPAKMKEAPKGAKPDDRSGVPPIEEPPTRRERPRRDRPPGGAQGETKPGGSALAVVEPSVPAKNKEGPKGAKPDVQSGPPLEELPARKERPGRERPPGSAQGETKPGGSTLAVVEPKEPAKKKESPKGVKPDERTGPPAEEPPEKKLKSKRERPPEGAQGETKPGGSALAVVEPTESAKNKEVPKGAKPVKPSGPSPEEPPEKKGRRKREISPGGVQGETKPGGTSQAVVEPAKKKESPRGVKPDERSGPPPEEPPEEPPARKKGHRTERPTKGAEGETKSGGSTQAVVESAKKKEAPKDPKLDERGGAPPEEPPPKRKKRRREGPPEGAQGETRPGVPAPAPDGPTVPAKTREAPKGAKSDERSGPPPEEQPARERRRKKRPPGGTQGETKPEGSASAVAEPSLSAKPKEAPKIAKQEKLRPPPEEPPPRREKLKEGPPQRAPGETKPGGSAPKDGGSSPKTEKPPRNSRPVLGLKGFTWATRTADDKQAAKDTKAQKAADAEKAKIAADAAKAQKAAEAEKTKRAAVAAKEQKTAEAEKAKRTADAAKAQKTAESEKAKRVADAAKAQKSAEATKAQKSAEKAKAQTASEVSKKDPGGGANNKAQKSPKKDPREGSSALSITRSGGGPSSEEPKKDRPRKDRSKTE